ncbi:MAG: ABC transporter related protein [uncultured bacterium]|nr:MAG: ABC transporter related protein [uncultured bacterium]
MKILEITELKKKYVKVIGKSSIDALNSISFELNKGEVLGVIGPNGSGKTTLFKCILGFIKPTSGNIIKFDNKFSGLELKKKMGFLSEKVNFNNFLTPVELLNFYGSLYGLTGSVLLNKINELLDMVDLENYKSMKVGGFSKGMLQRLGIAVSLINDCELLILDEPISGMDPFGAKKITEIIQELVKRGKTLILSSHVLSHVEDICSDILVLYKGKILRKGKLSDLVTDTNNYRIDIKVRNSQEAQNAENILKQNGFDISASSFSNQDLENIFVSLINGAK